MLTVKEHREALNCIKWDENEPKDQYKAKVIELYWKDLGVKTYFSKILSDGCKGYEIAKEHFKL